MVSLIEELTSADSQVSTAGVTPSLQERTVTRRFTAILRLRFYSQTLADNGHFVQW
jgi:hypothetical protein